MCCACSSGINLSVPVPASKNKAFAFLSSGASAVKSSFLSVPPVMRIIGFSKALTAAAAASGIVAAESL